MSQSVYDKIPSAQSTPTKQRKPRSIRRKSMPILHEHFEAGSAIRELRAHKDTITAIDFDAPFGTLVSAAMDDSVKVWDLNAGRCMGALEGHTASVRALQVEDNILATGSRDATIRLWDLSKAHYDPYGNQTEDEEDAIAFENVDDHFVEPPEGSMADCHMFTLQSHVDEITALHFSGDVLVSGSADKTIRHWDLEKGRCIQTLDVMWAAAQASASLGSESSWRQTGRTPSSAADFVGALQVFESALACGTADGMVRLWDLRSGQVHRSLVGHTGPVTCLQFDDVHLVTGSMDRSVRVSSSIFPEAGGPGETDMTDTWTDMGPADGLHLGRIRIRQRGDGHDVRRQADRQRGGRGRGQGVRQGGGTAVGLRRGHHAGRGEQDAGDRREGAGAGWLPCRGPTGRHHRRLDLLRAACKRPGECFYPWIYTCITIVLWNANAANLWRHMNCMRWVGNLRFPSIVSIILVPCLACLRW